MIAGALMAGLPLPARPHPLPAAARGAASSALFALLDGMLFVQSRIGMNDVYVGLFIIAAYTLFAAIWTGWWRGRGRSGSRCPSSACCSGLRWPRSGWRPTRSARCVLLLLVRSALGRVARDPRAHRHHRASSATWRSACPRARAFGNLTFLLIMVGLTLVAVVVAVLHPIAWTDEEMWFAVIAPAALGALVFFGALALGRLRHAIALGPIAVTPLADRDPARPRLARRVRAVPARRRHRLRAAGRAAGRRRPGAPPGAAGARPRAAGSGRAGSLGLPMVWAVVCLVAIPLVVYVIAYLPWAFIEDHQLWPGLPAGHTGQTLRRADRPDVRLPQRASRRPHPASSPWWAWPFDLKPVWFYQDGFARRTTAAAIYDAGNLVIWWFGRPGDGVRVDQAFRRRSLGAGAHRDRVRRASGCRGRASTAPRSSTTTTRRCRS